jgi:peptidoglycan/LPS O-acetylase OafA/YrhL
MNEKKANLNYIDSLRGIAILMVVLVHTTLNVRVTNQSLNAIGLYGQMGVQLFFIASAFTLCLSLERTIYTENWLGFFYLKRFFRIAPLYYLGIIVYFLNALVVHLALPATQYYQPRLTVTIPKTF